MSEQRRFFTEAANYIQEWTDAAKGECEKDIKEERRYEGDTESEDLQTFLKRAAAGHARAVLKEVGGARVEAAKRLGIRYSKMWSLASRFLPPVRGGRSGRGFREAWPGLLFGSRPPS
jgi:hypothetical protein